MNKILRNIFSENTFKNIIYYFLFLLGVAIVHALTVGVVSFFHFILGHDLGTVEEWLFDKAYRVIVFSKILCLWWGLRVVFVRGEEKSPIKSFLGFRKTSFSKEIMVSLIYLYFIIGLIFWGESVGFFSRPLKYLYNSQYSIAKLLVSFVGNTLNYLLDILFLLALNIIFPVKGKFKKIIFSLISSTLFYLSYKTIFSYGINLGTEIFFSFFFCIYLSFLGKPNWSRSFFFLVFFLSILHSFLGLDPIWGASFSPWAIEGEKNSYFIIIYFPLLLYLYGKNFAEDKRVGV